MKTTTKDMTSGPIASELIFFALPLLAGNLFQLLYNTVDTLVVGNFVGTEALAAVGSTTMIVNMMVLTFNGLSIGATVIIGQNFGARKLQDLHESIETTMAMTFLFGVIFTIVGIACVKPLLLLMATPDDVFAPASLYLTIYFAGISGLMIYNMGSGILRAVGDTKRPLYFLILTSVLNIILDLAFVLIFHLGIAGVAYATILSQFVSAILVLLLLAGTDDIYKMTWKDLRLNWSIFGRILAIGLPAAIQSIITSVSNVVVQSYINSFGSATMAGWSCYNKTDQFLWLPVQSMGSAATTFVSQNMGAKKRDRVRKGTFTVIGLALLITLTIALIVIIFAAQIGGIFTKDESVIKYAVLFIHTNTIFLLFNSVNHVLAGTLRGRGDSNGPMIIMLCSFVAIRQIYLYLVTHFFMNTQVTVALGYPVGWISCCTIEVIYALIRHGRAYRKTEGENNHD